MKHYGLIACHVLWRELFQLTSESADVFHPHFLELGLHDAPDGLREKIQGLVDENDDKGYEAILLGYGLCGNGTLGVRAGKTRLVLMRGHDCITFLLGSKDRYREAAAERPGTYWYSPGWIDNNRVPGKEQDEVFLAEYTEKYGAEQAEMMLNLYKDTLKGYTHASYINQELVDPAPYREYTKRNADYLGLVFEEHRGCDRLLRDFIGGNWDDDRFLIVPPGQYIVATVDDTVMRTAAEKST